MYLKVGDYCEVSIVNDKITIALEDKCLKVLDLSEEFPEGDNRNLNVMKQVLSSIDCQ